MSLLHAAGAPSPVSPAQMVAMLHSAGFEAAIVARAPSQVLSVLLPVVLLMADGQACVLLRRLPAAQADTGALYEILDPAHPDHVRVVSEADLTARYSGYLLLAGLRTASADGQAARDSGLGHGHWLWGTIRRFLPYYRSALLAAFLSNVLMLFTGLFASVVYDRIIPTQALVTLWAMAVGAFVAIGFDLIARQIRSYLIDTAGKKADLALGNLIFRKALAIRLEQRPDSAGGFAHRLAQIELVRDFSTSATLTLVSDLPFIALFVLATWLVAGPLVVVPLVAIPVLLGLTWAIQSGLRKLMAANMAQHADLHGVMVEAVEGMEDIRAAGAHGHFLRRYETANAAAAMSSLRARMAASGVNNVTMVSQQIVTVSVLVWGVHLVGDGALTSGAIVAAMMFSIRAVAPLSSVVSLATRYQGARAALRSLNELMALPDEREPDKRYLPLPNLKGDLALRDVRFAYPGATPQGEPPPMVLKGVKLQIRAGERVALLGKIGSGKSTILRLMAGLYQPTEGYVEVDRLDLRQIDPADFRAQVGYLSQEPRLFNTSLRDNVLLDRPNADPACFHEVAMLTGLDKIAAAHPLGFDLPVGEMGTMLSGGQRQLVALARCLVTRPRVMLLDEPTSSMDAQAEAGFIRHLKNVVNDCTLVVVTHRPAVLDVVDRVVVVDGGRVVIDGPKDKVLALLAGQRPVANRAEAAVKAVESAQVPEVGQGAGVPAPVEG